MELVAILDFALWKKMPGLLGGTGGLFKKRSIEVKTIVKPS